MELPKDKETREKLAAIILERNAAISWRCDDLNCDGLPHEGYPYGHARGKQQPPWSETYTDDEGVEQPYRRWYLRGGRGSGKTWAGAKAFAELILWYGGVDENGDRREYGVVGPSHNYTKETLVEGGSGLLKALGGPDGEWVEQYNKTSGVITLKNGAIVYSAGADNNGKGVEGKNLTAVWCDEVGLWARSRWQYTWESAITFAVRKKPSLFIITGTPKQGHPLVQKLTNDKRVKSVVMSTLDNTSLDKAMIAELKAQYEGTRIGRQELYGEVLSDVEGALWNLSLIEDNRVLKNEFDINSLKRIIVAIDPSGGSTSGNDEQGIIVAGEGENGQYYVLDDRSTKLSPSGWATVAIQAYKEYKADRIVAEKNFGGEMVESTIYSVDANVPVKMVSASRGKQQRMEPIAALYEQGRVHHVGVFPKLEDQMTQWTPISGTSPDRVDALVWALTELSGGVGVGQWVSYYNDIAEPAKQEKTAEVKQPEPPKTLEEIRQAQFKAGQYKQD
jgi:predicted phage terminase large subunit-like protein